MKAQAFDVIAGPHEGIEAVIIPPEEQRASAGHVFVRALRDGKAYEVSRRHLKPSRKVEVST